MSFTIERRKPQTGGFSISLSNGTKIELKKQEPAPAPPPAKPEEPKPEPPKKEEPKPEPPKKKEEPKPEPPKKKEPKPKKEEPKPVEEEDEEEEFTGEVLDESRKKHVNLVFIGHVDAGKSTLCGHLLVEAGIVDARTIEKYQKEAAAANRGSWYFSWVMDLAESERAKGKTEEVGVAHFETEVQKYTVLDAPGHRSFVPQMIGGAVQADVAVLVVSARTGEFEAGFERGGQTSEHLLIAKTAGVRYVVIVVNKMDDPTVKWDKKRYDFIVEKLTPFIKTEIGYKPDQFTFIPIAALGGGNLKERETQADWYKGPTLFEALDAVPLPERNEKDAFRLPVIDRYKAKTLWASGKIEKGVLTEGKNIIVMPSGVKGQVTGIFVDENKIRKGVPGDNIRVQLKGVEMADINSGSVICVEGDPCHVAERVIVKLKFTANAPSFMAAGFSAVCHIHTEIVGVTLDKLVEVLGPQKQKNPSYVRGGQMVVCILKFEHPICVETYAEFPQLGRFIIRHEGFTIAVGVVDRLPKSAAGGKAK